MILAALILDDFTKEVRQHRWRREEAPGMSPEHSSIEGEGEEEKLAQETEKEQTVG